MCGLLGLISFTYVSPNPLKHRHSELQNLKTQDLLLLKTIFDLKTCQNLGLEEKIPEKTKIMEFPKMSIIFSKKHSPFSYI